MQETWRDRLAKAVANDGRSLRSLSKAAGQSVNYVQQLLKDEKEPGVEKVIRLLRVLGSASTLYVITGVEISKDDEAFLEAALALQGPQKRKAAEFFETLRVPE